MRTRNIPIRNLLVGFLTALVGLMMLAATPPTYARSTYLIEWEFYYPDSRSDNNASCALCHQTIDGSNYNPYGNAIRSQSQTLPLTTRFANVEPLNSDADPGGYTNKQEIDASTQPGWKVGDAVPTGVTGDLDPILDPGILQFSSATYSVNENGGSVTITVTRTDGTAGNVDVTYATSDGTATAGSDYTFTTGTLTLADGVTSATFSVPIIDDTTFETNETVNLTLSSPTNGATLGTPSTAVLTIVENDPAPSAGSLQFSSATYSVNENGASVTIAVTRSGGDFGVVSVDYATSDGTASASNDYTATSGTLTLLDSQLSASFTVPILDDNDYEGDETVNLRLSNPTGGATLGTPSSAVLTIVEDDPIPSSGSLQFSSATYSVNENGVSISIGVTRTGGDFGEVTVDYTTSDGTASAGSDYTAASGTLTLADGVTIASFNVSILNDTAYEGNETVNLALSNPTGGATLGTPSGAVLTIVEDDPVPSAGSLQFSGATYSVDENGVSALITVTRIGGDFGEVTVDYTTSDGTASAGNDYTSTSGTLTLADGATSASFSVAILDDTTYEGDETVNLALSNPTGGATLGTPSSAVLTIVDNDPVPLAGSLQFSGATYSVAEDGVSVLITVTRTGGDFGEVTVDYTTSDGTASAGNDYTSTSGTLTLADGETSASFSVAILDDTTYEGDETVNLALSNPTGGATLGTPSSAVLTIVDNDPVPLAGSLQFSGATYSVAEDGGSILITVTRTGGDFGEVTVSYATSDGTATAGSDYTATSGTLTLADGETSASFSVPVIDDADYEGNETVNLALSNPTGGATLGTPSSAVLTIVDNDPVPLAGSLQFSGATYSVAEDGVSVLITVTRTGGDFGEVTVSYATSDGTASAGSDYTAASGTLTLADGVTSASFSVAILDDTTYEGNETVNLALSNPTGGATLGTPSNAVLTIVEDDMPPLAGSLQFSGATYSLAESGGSALITVTRTGGSAGVVSVDYATSDGTATAGSDYSATSGTLTLLDGETSASFNVPITDDTDVEDNETVNLALSNPTGGASLGSPSAAVLTILDDDPTGEGDAFLVFVNAPNTPFTKVGNELDRKVRVFGDSTVVQETTVTLAVEAPDGVEVEVSSESITAVAEPGRPLTHYFFDVSLECEAAGTYEIVWTATISAAANDDLYNDTQQDVTTLTCNN